MPINMVYFPHEDYYKTITAKEKNGEAING
jgi:hypothetical protein